VSAVLEEPSLTFHVTKEFMGLFRKFTHITLGPLETRGHVKWSNRVKPIILPRSFVGRINDFHKEGP